MDFLKSNNPPTISKNAFKVWRYWLPINYNEPFGILYKKKDPHAAMLTHVFILFYSSAMFEVFLPFNINDYKFYNKTMSFHVLPPMFDATGNEKWVHLNETLEDFSSNEQKKDGEENLVLKFEKNAFNNTVCIDPITKQQIKKEFDPNDVAGLFLIHDKDFRTSLNQ